jgi:hypothetical protein
MARFLSDLSEGMEAIEFHILSARTPYGSIGVPPTRKNRMADAMRDGR